MLCEDQLPINEVPKGVRIKKEKETAGNSFSQE
jgi:hypothetical protein